MKNTSFLLILYLFNSSLHAEGIQTYPNISGEFLYEDERVSIQKFTLPPGQWEGVHEHPEYQLVIVLNRTNELTYRLREKETIFHATKEDLLKNPMTAFWRPGPVKFEDQHNSGNTGTRPLEWIAITFKKESIAAAPAETLIPVTR